MVFIWNMKLWREIHISKIFWCENDQDSYENQDSANHQGSMEA